MANQKIRDERKITIKSVCGELPDVEKLLKAPEKSIDLMELVGIVRRAKADTHEMRNGEVSEFVRFYGMFRATSLATGEVVEAGQCLLPGAIQDKLYGALPQDGGEVSFAVRIGIKYNKDALKNYVYYTESLLPPAHNDPLSAIAASAGMKKLAAPTAPAEKK